ncbi:MAG: hypothetical protein JXR41_12270 [Bacteroidales bacterium]|nr:hypothetical protein [Bacteroidales bacterium]MBN2763861.1 hypothetical protein [Bacteroidales bacterium]
MKNKQQFLNDLYAIENIQEDSVNQVLIMRVKLNSSHEIFKGHFPGNPILPGVCTIQIVKELLSHHLKKNLMLKNAGTIKYIAFISPESNPVIDIELRLKDTEDELLSCKAKVFHEATVFCSFRGEYLEAP